MEAPDPAACWSRERRTRPINPHGDISVPNTISQGALRHAPLFQHTVQRITLFKGEHKAGSRWEKKRLHGNFHYWIQYRKTLAGECVKG
jgi:hypothetical protein